MRFLVHALIFCGVYLAVAESLGALIEHLDVPLDDPGTKSIKSDHYRIEKEGFDLLFVGSSRVFRQYHPRLFERKAAELGLELDAYNLGIPGMRFFEALDYVDWILDQDAERLKWIVFELQDPEPTSNEALRFTQRNIRWHSPHFSALAGARVLASDRSWREKVSEVSAHLGQGLLRLSNANTGLALSRSLLGWKYSVPDKTPGGFFPLEMDGKRDVKRRREVFLSELDKDPKFLTKQAKRTAFAIPLEPAPWMLAELGALVERAEACGVEVTFVISPPADHNYVALERVREAAPLPRTFAYDPSKYPLLYYEPELRFDLQHLNLEGAKKLTGLFARQFVRHVRRKGDG
ncbi:MAG: hypothetical protein CMJ89_17625 [Planctomycetes bacterium]|jgi:hypothetical protein|nr:hypothetical protein [Planctomycetota bacterium]